MTDSYEVSGMIGLWSGAVIALVFSISIPLGPGSLADESSGLGSDVLKVAAQDFHFRCAACHGTSGRGDGPMAQAMKIQPPDLTRIAQRNGGVFPDALVFRTISGLNMPISHGTRDMPVWGDVFIGEALGESTSIEDSQEVAAQVTERIRRLVKYLESIQVSK
jgi:hypothetical protein